jgi:hypothetical protein
MGHKITMDKSYKENTLSSNKERSGMKTSRKVITRRKNFDQKELDDDDNIAQKELDDDDNIAQKELDDDDKKKPMQVISSQGKKLGK